jgi:hypothetical protein
MRDDFSGQTKAVLAQRVGYLCSKPDCRAYTSGPQVDPAKAVNVGVAAHITAASEGGPRYDKGLTPDQRSDINNAIWLCQTCAKLVDNDPARYSTAELRRWKRVAERAALLRIGKSAVLVGAPAAYLSAEEVDLLMVAADSGEIFLLSADQSGNWVRAGGKDYIDWGDPAHATSYVEALDSLCSRGLARHDGGILYRLTTAGFRLGRELKERELLANPDPGE